VKPWLCIIGMNSIVGCGYGASVEEGLLSEFRVHLLRDGASSGFLRSYVLSSYGVSIYDVE